MTDAFLFSHLMFYVDAVFFGFGLFSLFIACVPKSKFGTKPYTTAPLYETACYMAAVAGIIWMYNQFMFFGTLLNENASEFKRLMFGPYWISCWYMLLYGCLTQLLWIQKLRNNRVFRGVIGFWLLRLPVLIWLITAITSLHRDYLPSSWSTQVGPQLLEWLIKLLVFFTLVIVVHFGKSRWRKNRERRLNN